MRKGHLKEFPMAKEWNNVNKKMNNILLDYNPKYKIYMSP